MPNSNNCTTRLSDKKKETTTEFFILLQPYTHIPYENSNN